MKKFHSIVIFLTTVFCYCIWITLKELSTIHPIGITILAATSSIGVYRTIFNLSAYSVKKWKRIKKIILRDSYFEGTWAGFYYGVNGKVRFFIENFEQDIDNLKMKGITYNENQQFHSTYFSDYININQNKNEINYLYTVQSANEYTDGIGLARFDYFHDTDSPYPSKLLGTTKDKHLNKQCIGFEIKISDEILDGTENIIKAVEIYEKYKDKIQS